MAIAVAAGFAASTIAAQSRDYVATLQTPGGPLEFDFQVTMEGERIERASIRNGSELIEIEPVNLNWRDPQLRIRFPHYDSELSLHFVPDRSTAHGQWCKRPGSAHPTVLPLEVRSRSDPKDSVAEAAEFVGRWELQFALEPGTAIGEFQRGEHSPVEGTILTETGDYRYLAGGVAQDGSLRLATFDGSHAFLLRFQLDGPQRIRGDFWSGSTYHDTLQGSRNEQAELADGFQQASVVDPLGWQNLEFPDLNGAATRLEQPPSTPLTLLHLFGSWCPNCHDAAELFGDLHNKYHAKGLRIIGLAFEQNGELSADAAQVRWYIERHAVPYPILLAGSADKRAASGKLPFLDRLRAFPTTVFIDGDGKIFAVYSGFSGPATGLAGERLAENFERLIREHLPDHNDR